MARRYLSGIMHDYGAGYPGRFMHRVMVEWLSQVVGWPVVDLIGSNWNNVAASGTGACDSTANDTLVISSPSYAITKSHEGWYITLTGFSGGNEDHDGIYRIRQFVGAVGSLYTVKIFPDIGVHHLGVPVQSGLNWRLWAGTDTYCPSTTSDIAVLAGKGTTGAGLNSGTRSSVSLSVSQSGSTSTLTDSGATFLDSDVGKSITVSGSAVGGNNNTFVITARLSNTQIEYTNASGGNDSFTGSWSITYDFHVRFRCNTWNYGYGGTIMSPWASWDPATHTWKVGDSRYTSEHSPNFVNVPDSTQVIGIWAEADRDHFIFHIHTMWLGSYSRTFHFMYSAGEMDAFYPDLDPRPCYLWNGFDNYYQNQVPGMYPILGTGMNSGCTFYNGIRALAHDDITTVTCYPIMVHCLGSTDYNAISGLRRLVSTYPPGTRFYRMPIYVECRTANYMEIRGKLRHMWAANVNLTLHGTQGLTGEYFHITRGVLVPWNGAQTVWPTAGWLPIG